MVCIPKKYTYLGIDETSRGIGNNSSIIVAAQTSNPSLAKDYGPNSLKKTKDLIREALQNNSNPEFPELEEMKASGLETYHWTRAKGGRFSLKQLQHASIANVILVNGYKPQETIILIDAFYANYQKSKYLIKEYGYGGNLKVLPLNLKPQYYSIGVPENSKHLEAVNQQLLKIISDRNWGKALSNYLGN